MKLHFYVIILLCSMTQNSYAQNNLTDCDNAFRICNLGDYHFSEMDGFGSIENLHIENTNIKETNSVWLQFTAETDGDLVFVIVPDKNEDDIDFVLFEGFDCNSRIARRVMTSGRIIGDDTNINCLGQTGLQTKSRDLEEYDGCYKFDDNFLKPMRLLKGQNYYLLVNNFNSSRGFTVLFSGDENLKLHNKCDKVSNSSPLELVIFPNPASNEITIMPKTGIEGEVEVQMFDPLGRILLRKAYNNMLNNQSIDISDLPAGDYYVRIIHDKYVGLKSFIKI